jgi:8-oxo-dGTP diphosphatase
METPIIEKPAWICIKDKKVLMARSHGKDVFYTPGGGREEGETSEEALIREVKEELLVDLVPETIQLYGVFIAPAHGRAEGTLVQMTCYTADYVGELQVDDVEIAEFAWFTSADRDKLSEVGHLVFDDLVAKGLIE